MPRAALSSRSRQQPPRPHNKRRHIPLFHSAAAAHPAPYTGRYTSVYKDMPLPSPITANKPLHLLASLRRSIPTYALLCTVALAFFVFGVLFSQSVSSMFDPSSPQHFGLPTRNLNLLNRPAAPAPPDPHLHPAAHAEHNSVPQHPPEHPLHNHPHHDTGDPPPDCCVGMWRSWPISQHYDYTHLHQVANHLNFTNNTLLNYFHMHKTGGVTTKVQVMVLIRRYENRIQKTHANRPLTVIETCYQQNYTNPEDNRLESTWHCDFGQVEGFTPQKLASIDMVMGHQYWEEGCEMYFGPIRDVKHFSIFRHPLARKLSFFYHFFVRNLQRDENQVSKDEVIAFLLGDGMPENDALTRDAGPNYYASRMISDGVTGFVNHRYVIPKHREEEAIANVLHKLQNKYAFVGLQLQPEASQCMLQKMVQVFAHVHGLDKMYGTPKLSESKKRLNTGGYPWTPRKIWRVMTPEQRQRYKEVERVDLAIYDHVVQRFKEDLKAFACEHRVHHDQWIEDRFDDL